VHTFQRPRFPGSLPVAATLLLVATPAFGGVVNPDISVIGQPFLRMTDDPDDPDDNHPRLDVGETEFVFDAALNPYAHGTVVMALGDEGAEIEEGFFQLTRGLPGNLALKGGKYRVGFGRLNALHPHAYPFAERPRVLAAYLPGDESFNETGISISRLFPVAGDFAITAAADYLQGDGFRPAEDDDAEPGSRPALLGRISGFTLLGEQSALEFGFSGTRGRNDIAAKTSTTILGADAKAKLWTSPRAYLVLQGEVLRLDLETDLCPDCASPVPLLGSIETTGGYLFADYNWAGRYNAGVSYERYQEPVPFDRPVSQAFGLFAGLALLEETTAFRADWNHFQPDFGDKVNTFTLRVIYSMGPHKAHQF